MRGPIGVPGGVSAFGENEKPFGVRGPIGVPGEVALGEKENPLGGTAILRFDVSADELRLEPPGERGGTPRCGEETLNILSLNDAILLGVLGLFNPPGGSGGGGGGGSRRCASIIFRVKSFGSLIVDCGVILWT